jgi:O-glycosyl hydrolase
VGFLASCIGPASGQPETLAWGNINGIRVDGHLFELNSSLCAVAPDGKIFQTGRERQTNSYSRNGDVETVTVQTSGKGWSLNGRETVEDLGDGGAVMDVWFDSPKEGTYWCLDLPQYSGALAAGANASHLRLTRGSSAVSILFGEPAQVKGGGDSPIMIAVARRNRFIVGVTGEIDHNPIAIAIDAAHPGQLFDGMGGNFRLQNAKADPGIIDYNLKNLRVAWGRVEMPWRNWQPDEHSDPLAAARAGTLDPRVAQAMEMARRLAEKGMPVIVSAWFAPQWAILPDRPEGARGNPLNPAKTDQIKKSIADYLVWLKEKFGVEAAMFTFNESDLGIDVRQTAQEHADMIKTFGPYFASRGLATKLALGDTSDATPVDFIQPALHDPEAAKYIAAVDFHSWRGCTDEILAQRYAAARQLNVPLIVAEGSTDAAAYKYPQIFAEQQFALYEINLYLRILARAQPRSILQWQLTSDYSLLAGGGAFGDNGPIRPTRRFWNFKQLASTPERSFALPVASNGANLTCAAFGDIAGGIYTVHIVNNGASRQATLTGFPANVKELRMWVTDSTRGMEEGARIPVTGGKADVKLDATSYTTVISVP